MHLVFSVELLSLREPMSIPCFVRDVFPAHDGDLRKVVMTYFMSHATDPTTRNFLIDNEVRYKI